MAKKTAPQNESIKKTARKKAPIKKTSIEKAPVTKAAADPSKGTQPNAITIRGSVAWKEWLDRFAKRMRSKPTGIIDLALAKLADQEQFEAPPDRM